MSAILTPSRRRAVAALTTATTGPRPGPIGHTGSGGHRTRQIPHEEGTLDGPSAAMSGRGSLWSSSPEHAVSLRLLCPGQW